MEENSGEQISLNGLTKLIIGCAIAVHRKLGPGFLESVYQAALAHELSKAAIPFERKKGLGYAMRTCCLTLDFDATFLSIDV